MRCPAAQTADPAQKTQDQRGDHHDQSASQRRQADAAQIQFARGSKGRQRPIGPCLHLTSVVGHHQRRRSVFACHTPHRQRDCGRKLIGLFDASGQHALRGRSHSSPTLRSQQQVQGARRLGPLRVQIEIGVFQIAGVTDLPRQPEVRGQPRGTVPGERQQQVIDHGDAQHGRLILPCFILHVQPQFDLLARFEAGLPLVDLNLQFSMRSSVDQSFGDGQRRLGTQVVNGHPDHALRVFGDRQQDRTMSAVRLRLAGYEALRRHDLLADHGASARGGDGQGPRAIAGTDLDHQIASGLENARTAVQDQPTARIDRRQMRLESRIGRRFDVQPVARIQLRHQREGAASVALGADLRMQPASVVEDPPGDVDSFALRVPGAKVNAILDPGHQIARFGKEIDGERARLDRNSLAQDFRRLAAHCDEQLSLAAVDGVRQREGHLERSLLVGRRVLLQYRLTVNHRLNLQFSTAHRTALGPLDREAGGHLIPWSVALATKIQAFAEPRGRELPDGQIAGHVGKLTVGAAGDDMIRPLGQIARDLELAVPHALLGQRLGAGPGEHVSVAVGDLGRHRDFLISPKTVAVQRDRAETHRLAGAGQRLVEIQMRDELGLIDDKGVRQRRDVPIARRPDFEPHETVGDRGRCLDLKDPGGVGQRFGFVQQPVVFAVQTIGDLGRAGLAIERLGKNRQMIGGLRLQTAGTEQHRLDRQIGQLLALRLVSQRSERRLRFKIGVADESDQQRRRQRDGPTQRRGGGPGSGVSR